MKNPRKNKTAEAINKTVKAINKAAEAINKTAEIIEKSGKTNTEVPKEKILERLDAYRAIEINNLWQRSVFLGTFLVLGFTGYAFLLDKIIDAMYEADKVGKLDYLNFIASVLACVNILFSMLWIAMAKGSKAWYEVYENAIIYVENSENPITWAEIRAELSLNIDQSTICNNECNNNCFKCNRKEKKLKKTKNDCLFSTKSGGYSPSKINIVIGQIAMILWVGVLLTHLVSICSFLLNSLDILSFKYFFLYVYPVDVSLIFVYTIIILFSAIVTCVLLFTTKWIKSSYFSDKKE